MSKTVTTGAYIALIVRFTTNSHYKALDVELELYSSYLCGVHLHESIPEWSHGIKTPIDKDTWTNVQGYFDMWCERAPFLCGQPDLSNVFRKENLVAVWDVAWKVICKAKSAKRMEFVVDLTTSESEDPDSCELSLSSIEAEGPVSDLSRNERIALALRELEKLGGLL